MTKQIVEVFNKTTTRIKSIAFHPTNQVMITAHHCGTIYMWNYLYQQVIAVLHEHTGSVRAIKIHSSGELFATAGDDKIVRIWNYKTRSVVHRLKGHTDYVRCLDFHPTKPWIVTGSDDFTIKIWNFYTGEMISSSCGQTHYIMSVLFLDSTHILSGSLDHTMSLWSCANLFEKKKFLVPVVVVTQQIEAHSRGVNCMFLANGKVISGSDDREIKIWRYVDENLIIEKSLYIHEGNVNAVYCDETTIYGGGEDSILSYTRKDKSQKIQLESRIWTICGKDDYLAVGTDDGLVLYRTVTPLSYCISGSDIYYSIDGAVFKYNTKQSLELFTSKKEITNMVKHDDLLYVMSEKQYDVFRENKRESGNDEGSIAFVKNDKYQLKAESLYKNNELYRSNISGKLYSKDNILVIVDKKSVTRIKDDLELSSTFNFQVNTIAFGDDKLAIIGSSKILIVDLEFKVLETITELVEITGGFFHEDLFIYTTLRHIKFFYQDTGILQSIEAYSIPIRIHSDYLILLTSKGIERILLNLAEIRFRRAVFKDENILGVIEEEQLPGLSPLEYLINKNKGGIALPYIKNDEKRFQLFISDKNFDDALSLSTTYKMNEELAFAALQEGRYDISEICFKKNQDNINLFYLYLSTNQLDKMKDLEGDDIENMVKIVNNDSSLLSAITNQVESELNIDSGIVHSELKTIKDTESVNPKNSTAKQQKIIDSKANSTSLNNTPIQKANDTNKFESEKKIQDENSSNEQTESSSEKDIDLLSQKSTKATSSLPELSSLNIKETPSNNTLEQEQSESSSDLRTDLATCNDSDAQVFDISEIRIPDHIRKQDYTEFYQDALNFTTQGKFIKAIESFKIAISIIALKIKNPTDYLDVRKRIGNYLLGLYIEKERKKIDDPVLNVEMSLFFAELDLDPVHIPLAKNLALTNCYKHGNFKTAKEIAREFPMCRNSGKVLESSEDSDTLKVAKRPFSYGSLSLESNLKECALCGVKSKDTDICPACEIGCLH